MDATDQESSLCAGTTRSTQMAEEDAVVSGTWVPEAPVANHTLSIWDDMTSNSWKTPRFPVVLLTPVFINFLYSFHCPFCLPQCYLSTSKAVDQATHPWLN